ncbi:MAG: sigma 54-interacting transcriptional regulator [Pseudomonadota bacterium]
MKSARKLLYVSPHPCPPALEENLRERGWEIAPAASLRAAGTLLRREPFWVGLLVVDEGDPPRGVAAEFEACREADDACEWVAVLPPGAMQVPALRDLVVRHCFDHHTHPADPSFLARSLGHAWGRAQLRRASDADASGDDLGLTGTSAAMAQLRRLLRRAAVADTPVLITGEAGSGKERVARALHACSPRADGPFVVVDCTALQAEPADLLQQAGCGTLLLDHVGELPLDWQVRLLRLMAERAAARSRLGRGSTDLRIVAATDADLADAVATRRFREDLFYRLNVVPLTVPPLRSRKEDIPALARQFHVQCARDGGSIARGFSRQAMAAMAAHAWPGNVRELFNRVQRAVVMAERRMVCAADLGLQAEPAQPLDNLETIRVRAEKDAISLSLDRFSHNVTLAARELGVSRMTLYRLMAKYSISTRAG